MVKNTINIERDICKKKVRHIFIFLKPKKVLLPKSNLGKPIVGDRKTIAKIAEQEKPGSYEK